MHLVNYIAIILEGRGDWSNEGCSNATGNNEFRNQDTVICKCNHLSTFGVFVVRAWTMQAKMCLVYWKWFYISEHQSSSVCTGLHAQSYPDCMHRYLQTLCRTGPHTSRFIFILLQPSSPVLMWKCLTPFKLSTHQVMMKRLPHVIENKNTV